MARRNGQLTHKEKTFAERYAATGDKHYAATVAGYAQPAVGAHRALNDPAVLAQIAKHENERIVKEALPKATDHLLNCLASDTAPWNAKNGAAKLVFERVDKITGGQDSGKEGHELTGEELSRMIAGLQHLQREVSDGAKVIEHEPSSIDDEDSVFS